MASACSSASDCASHRPALPVRDLDVDAGHGPWDGPELCRVVAATLTHLAPYRLTDGGGPSAGRLHVAPSPHHLFVRLAPAEGFGRSFDIALPWPRGRPEAAHLPALLRTALLGIADMAALEAAGEGTLALALLAEGDGARGSDPVARARAHQLQAFAIRRAMERKEAAALPNLLALLGRAGAGALDRDLALKAVGALVALGDRRAVGPIIDLGRHQDAALVVQLAFAVGALGGPLARAYLVTLGSGHDDAVVREQAAVALSELVDRERAAR